MNIKQWALPDNQYIKEVSKKTQIVLHHTVSGMGVSGDVNWWASTPDKIATAFIIDREGVIWQLFDEKYWAYHLGLATKHFQKNGLPYKNLEKSTIGIELDSWGPVQVATDGKYYPVKWEGNKFVANTKAKPVQYFYEYCQQSAYRGHRYYEMYATAQLQALKELLNYLCHKHGISKKYNEDMWGVSKKALSGNSGIFSHTSYRSDKSDCHPQTELIAMLRSL